MKTLSLVLILAVTWVTGYQISAEAALVPAPVVQTTATSDRSADVAVIQKALESKLLRNKLKAVGLNEAEIETRLSKMSDAQVHQFASQIRAVNPAGDAIVYVLVVVVLVLFIIYLMKRI
jgi:hypothetical protein